MPWASHVPAPIRHTEPDARRIVLHLVGVRYPRGEYALVLHGLSYHSVLPAVSGNSERHASRLLDRIAVTPYPFGLHTRRLPKPPLSPHCGSLSLVYVRGSVTHARRCLEVYRTRTHTRCRVCSVVVNLQSLRPVASPVSGGSCRARCGRAATATLSGSRIRRVRYAAHSGRHSLSSSPNRVAVRLVNSSAPVSIFRVCVSPSASIHVTVNDSVLAGGVESARLTAAVIVSWPRP